MSRGVVIGCALILAAPELISVARADGPCVSSPPEGAAARAELDATLARMTSTSRRARDMLRVARKHGTTRQVSCLDEALSRSDVAYRSARDQAVVSLAAYGRNDLTAARAARGRVAELDDAQRLAAREGAACLPRPALAERIATGTVVRLIVDPSIPPELTP